MSNRRELEGHRHQLTEIREIMKSMKNLAYLQTRKLSQHIKSQHDAVVSIEMAAAELIYFYPDITPTMDESSPVVLVIGSERGFCGDYNDVLLSHLNDEAPDNSRLIVVGSKLSQRLEENEHVLAVMTGATVMDEIGDIINRIIESLATMQLLDSNSLLKIMYHDPSSKQVVLKNILPAFVDMPDTANRYTTAPDINLSPSILLSEITEHYLLALLYHSFSAALVAENLSRIDHMENALQRIDEKTQTLDQKCNVLRQEEITEEIEIILLNTRLTGKRREKHLSQKDEDKDEAAGQKY